MKKIIPLLLTLCICIGFIGCDRYSDTGGYNDEGFYDQSDWYEQEVPEDISSESINETAVTLSNDFAKSYRFKNGKAVVQTHTGEHYCINTKGEVIFQIPDGSRIWTTYDHIIIEAKNGYYNTDGVFLSSEETGVREIHDNALYDGFLLAEVVESTFDSAIFKLGVLDVSFNWIIEPSEELYQIFLSESADFDLNSGGTEYGDGYFYSHTANCYWSVTTGEFMDEIPGGVPANLWDIWQDNWKDPQGNIMATPEIVGGDSFTKFVNNKKIYVKNNPTGDQYFYILDNNGKVLFDPIPLPFEIDPASAETDGTYILFENGFGRLAVIYDMQGNLVTQWDASQDPSLDRHSFNWSLSEGILTLYDRSPKGEVHEYYYDIHLNELF